MPGTKYDLIVVGGGPAGAAATLWAHRHGLRALLLDRAAFPRDKTCGDALSGKALKALGELGLADDVARLPGAWIEGVQFSSPDGSTVRVDTRRAAVAGPASGQGSGRVVRREVLDGFLFDRARRAATACLEGFEVRDLVRDGAVVQGVRGRWRGDRDGVELEYHARLVLGCDGYRSAVGRAAGARTHDPRHCASAIRQYFDGVAGLGRYVELHFLADLLPGYFWIFPTGDGGANVGLSVGNTWIRERNLGLRGKLAQIIDRPPFAARFADARAVGRATGWQLPLGSRRRSCSGDGFLLLGDAAGLVDPFTGEGIGNALRSARIAVEAAAEALAAGDCSAAFLQRYDQRLWERIGGEMRASSRLQSLARHRVLLDYVVGKASRHAEVREAIAAMLGRASLRRQLTNPLFYLRLLTR